MKSLSRNHPPPNMPLFGGVFYAIMPPMNSRRALASLLHCFSLLFTMSVLAADWPAWRGPLGTGISAEKNLPTKSGAGPKA